MFLGNTTSTSIDRTCNLFADHFSSVFSHIVPTASQVNDALESVPANVLNFNSFEFSEDEVKAAATKLKPSSSPGPDGIPSIVLKNCADSLAKPLCTIFNKSIASAVFPSCWKRSFLVPVFKKGDKRDISNYRGITSLCAGSKLLEILLCKSLAFILKSYISIDQHGFFTGRSTNTNLVEFTSFCLRNMEGGGQVDAVYTDLKAAFDRISHKILLAKLDRLGMPSSLVRWFESYLTDRSMTVKLGNAESSAITCPSGVPQGSNIGPMFFSAYYNDVSFVLPAGCRLLYADDLKIFHVIQSDDDCRYLQDLINAFANWCEKNLLSLSIQKCSVISFTRKRLPVVWTYAVGGEALERVYVVKDLGVLLDAKLTYDNHYCNIITKAIRNLGFLIRTAKEFRDLSCLRVLFYALVRSHLEFAVIVWSPYDRIWRTRFERVQKKFAKFALRFHPLPDNNIPLSYENRRRILGLASLDQRRTFLRASFIGKLLLGTVDAPNILERVNINVMPRPLRTREFLRLDLQRTLYGQNEPIRAMCDVFNCVYDVFDFGMSVNSFLSKLRSLLFTS